MTITTNQKIAILSDIHGNSSALKAVLKDIKDRGIKTIVNLGDSLYGPLDPKGTYELLIKHNVISISGNQDRFILENLHIKSEVTTLEYVKSQLDDNVFQWLKTLPFDLIYEDIYCCHASPNNDMEYLLEILKPQYIAIKNFTDINTLLKDLEQDVIVCGHSHIPRIVKTDNKTICNVGSVGLPAYDDDLPIRHKMENFSPYARYSVIKILNNSYKIEQIAIPYDYESAARKAEENNRNDWAKWIRTGRV